MAKATGRRHTLTVREASAVAVYALQCSWTMGELIAYVRDEYSGVDCIALDLLFDCMGGVLMARGGKAAPGTKSEQWTQFVDVSLAGVTSDDIAAEFGDSTSLGNAVDALLRSGYRLGLSYTEGRHAFTVSLTCRDDSSPNAGCTLTAFAGDWAQAIAVVLYKHYVISRENWKGASPAGSSAAFG